LAGAPRSSGNSRTRCRRIRSHSYAWHRLVRYCLTGGRRRRRARPGQRSALSRFRGANRSRLLFLGDHIVDRAGGRRTDLPYIAVPFGLQLARSGHDPIRFVDGFDSRWKPRRTRAAEHVAVADCAGRADQSKTEDRHQQGRAMPAHAYNFIILILLLSCMRRSFTIFVLLLGGIEFIIDVISLVVGAILVALTR